MWPILRDSAIRTWHHLIRLSWALRRGRLRGYLGLAELVWLLVLNETARAVTWAWDTLVRLLAAIESLPERVVVLVLRACKWVARRH